MAFAQRIMEAQERLNSNQTINSLCAEIERLRSAVQMAEQVFTQLEPGRAPSSYEEIRSVLRLALSNEHRWATRSFCVDGAPRRPSVIDLRHNRSYSRGTAISRWSFPAAPAPAFAGLVRLTIEGANINTRFRTALPCSLAFRDSVRFALVAADAGIDIDAAIGRLNLRCGASDDGEGQQGEKHYSLHVPVLHSSRSPHRTETAGGRRLNVLKFSGRGFGAAAIAKRLGVGRASVYRALADA
jgi:hypothetical protein